MKFFQIGLDAEMVPTIVKYRDSPFSLFQLSSTKKIWILDFLPKQGKKVKEMFDLFNNEILQNESILKLGLGVKGDIKKFKKSFKIEKEYVS